VGDFRFAVVDGKLEGKLPLGCKLDFKPNDPPMGEKRSRLRCFEAGNNKEVNISQVRISKISGRTSTTVFQVLFSDLASKGKELKVMLWFDSDEH
jgi:hypothetical protein